MISLKRIFCTCCLLLSVWAVFAQGPSEWKALEKPLNFYLANDLGRNGYYDQKPIAELMGQMAENVDIEAVVAAGDVHHFEGVRSVNDPLWMTNYELVYSHPELMIPWYPILGNHEYRGNTQAVLDYSQVSARWEMPARYYTKVLENDDITVRLVMIDTAPLLDKYRKDTEKYPDACKQDMDKQLNLGISFQFLLLFHLLHKEFYKMQICFEMNKLRLKELQILELIFYKSLLKDL